MRNSMPKDGFALWEKTIGRGGFYGIMATGAVAFYSENVWLGMAYTLFLVIFPLTILGLTICTRCPYPCDYGTCLFMPVRINRWFYKPKTTPLSKIETVGFYISFLGIAVVPLYWIFKQPLLTALFLFFALPFYGYFFLYCCRRCRNTACPFNRCDIKKAVHAGR